MGLQSATPRPVRILVAPWTVTEGESYSAKAGRQAVLVVLVGLALAGSAYVAAPWVAGGVSGTYYASCDGMADPLPQECLDRQDTVERPLSTVATAAIRNVAPYAVPSVLALWLLVAGVASVLGGEPTRGELPTTLERTSWGILPLLAVPIARLALLRGPPPAAGGIETTAAARTFAMETLFGTALWGGGGHPVLWRASLAAFLWSGYVFAWTVAVDREVSVLTGAAVVAVPMGILTADAAAGTPFASLVWRDAAVGLGLCVVGLVPLVGPKIWVGWATDVREDGREGVETVGRLGSFGQLLALFWQVVGLGVVLAGTLLIGTSLHVV